MVHTEGVPKRLAHKIASEREARASVEASTSARKRAIAGKRDITKRVHTSAAMPYDTTQNGANMRKSRKLTDRIERHASEQAYVLDDTRIYDDAGKLRAVKRTSSRLVVRNADGTTNVGDTLAVVERWRIHRASNNGR